jgi:hypothetical protein
VATGYTLDDYIILRTESRKEMKDKVIEKAEKDFIPQGGICAVVEVVEDEDKKKRTVTAFYQAVMKRK